MAPDRVSIPEKWLQVEVYWGEMAPVRGPYPREMAPGTGLYSREIAPGTGLYSREIAPDMGLYPREMGAGRPESAHGGLRGAVKAGLGQGRTRPVWKLCFVYAVHCGVAVAQ